MLLAINYLAVLIYGVLIMALLLDIKINRKDILILSVYVVLSGLLQLVLFSAYGEEFIEKTYPLVIHLPLFLLFVWFYKKRFVSVLFVLFTAYFLTTPRKLIGDLVSSFFNHDPSLSIVVQLIASVLLLLVIYRYLRPFVIQILEHKGAQTILLTVMPALYYFLAYATVYTDTLYRSSVLVIGMLGVILNFCFYLFLIIYFNEMTKSFAAQTEQTILQLEIDATVTQIEDYKASQMQAAIYRHDLRHHLYYLSTLIAEHHIEESLDYITRINSDVEAAQVVQYCENMPVNLILSSYAAQSKNNNIAIEIHAIVPTEIPIKSTDICVILANGIENAIHACMKIEDVGCRKLTVMCMFENKKLKIAICNPFLGEIRFEKDIPLSEESNHGFGVKSIVAAVQKYQGVYSFAAENGIFAMRVILQ